MRKTLLVLSPWFPYPPDNGSRLRACHLLRELAAVFRIRLIAGVQADSPDRVPAPLAALCEAVTCVPWRWYDGGANTGTLGTVRSVLSPVPRMVQETPNPEMTAAIRAEIVRHPAAILAMELGMDAYLPDEAFALPVVLDQVELSPAIHANNLRQRLTGTKAQAYWRKRLRRYDAITAVSEEEANAVRSVVGELVPVVVVPNGVDIGAYPTRDPQEIVPGRLLYNGSLTYGPNREAVCWFLSDIMPLVRQTNPDAHLVVTGRYHEADVANLPEIAEGTVRLTGFLPDVRPELAKARLSVVPLRTGSGGTRLKILEAWAAGVPVVSTTVGAVGLMGRDTTHLLVRDSPDAFADAVSGLLNDPARWATLAAQARSLVAERYDWRQVAAPLIATLNNLIGIP